MSRWTWSLYLKKARTEEKSEWFQPATVKGLLRVKDGILHFLQTESALLFLFSILSSDILYSFKIIFISDFHIFRKPHRVHQVRNIYCFVYCLAHCTLGIFTSQVFRKTMQVLLHTWSVLQSSNSYIQRVSFLYVRGKKKPKWLFKLCSLTQILTQYHSKS